MSAPTSAGQESPVKPELLSEGRTQRPQESSFAPLWPPPVPTRERLLLVQKALLHYDLHSVRTKVPFPKEQMLLSLIQLLPVVFQVSPVLCSKAGRSTHSKALTGTQVRTALLRTAPRQHCSWQTSPPHLCPQMEPFWGPWYMEEVSGAALGNCSTPGHPSPPMLPVYAQHTAAMGAPPSSGSGPQLPPVQNGPLARGSRTPSRSTISHSDKYACLIILIL